MTNAKLRSSELAKELSVDTLRNACTPESLGFETTADLDGLDGLIGQSRATDAIRLSAQMRHRDFNMFVLGREGSGRHAIVTQLLEEQRNRRPKPSEWVYVNNFEAPDKPKALRLPP